MDTEISYHESERTVSFNHPGLSAITLDLSSSVVFAEVLFVQKTYKKKSLSDIYKALIELDENFFTGSDIFRG